MEVNVKQKHCFRIGNLVVWKTRLIKIIMNSEGDKDKVTDNLRKLKNADECFKTIRVTDDHTIEEREIIKEWVAKGKESKEKDENSHYLCFKHRQKVIISVDAHPATCC